MFAGAGGRPVRPVRGRGESRSYFLARIAVRLVSLDRIGAPPRPAGAGRGPAGRAVPLSNI